MTKRAAIASAAPTTTRLMTNVNNSGAIVTSAPPSPPSTPSEARRQWLRRWWWLVTLATVMSIVSTVFVVSLVIHVPYVIEGPGEVQAVQNLIHVPSDHDNPTTDRIDLVTVTVNTEVTLFDKLRVEHFSDDEVLVPAKNVLGSQTPQQNDQLNAVLMRQSKDSAVVTALAKLGYHVTPTQTGALIEDVTRGTPADGAVQVGDTIVAVDGQPIASRDDLVAGLGAHKPGDVVTLGIEDSNGKRTDKTVTLADHPDKPGTGFLGVAAVDRLSYPSLPFDVTIDSQRIGGPSAGLAFTLGLLDQLTPGDLTGGKEVAATGTISPDGTVGEIGGIQQKVTTVRRAHVKYFLVPVEDAADARGASPGDVQIVPVHTLDDALTFLATIGGQGLPPVPAAS